MSRARLSGERSCRNARASAPVGMVPVRSRVDAPQEFGIVAQRGSLAFECRLACGDELVDAQVQRRLRRCNSGQKKTAQSE